MCRIVPEGRPVAPLLDGWATDRALPAATELVVQTGPAATGFAAHLATMRAVAGALRAASASAAFPR
jgi:hypothetical protein